MTDSQQERGTTDPTRVNLEDDYNLVHWTTKFDCTAAELQEAVNKVGDKVAAVEKELAHRR